jgi:DNA-binding NtrC family response regulator
MESLPILIKKKLTKKTQTRETKKILLIDKEKHSALSTSLAQEGYDVVHCDSVHKAWNLVYPRRPHVIILSLGDSNGTALFDLQECRVLAEGVPIILATSAHINRAIIKAPRHGAAAVVAATSTPESVSKALHGLEASTMNK